MSAKTEPPKTHSPAAEAAHSPAEPPEPISVFVSGAALQIETCGFGQARRCCDISFIPKTRPATADESESDVTESDAPDAARTLETPYTGSSSRPLQSPLGPYPYLAAAAATSRNFGGGSAETKSLQLTFAWRR